MCGSKWWGVILALVVIIFTLWTPAMWTKWLVVAAGIIMLLHAFGFCGGEKVKPKGKKKK